MALKRNRKAKSSTLTTGAPTTAAQASGSSQAGPSSHGHPELGHPSSLGQAGVSSQSIPVHGGQSLPVAGDPTTYHSDHVSDSDSIQGSWNMFLDKICFPCGHYEDHWHEDFGWVFRLCVLCLLVKFTRFAAPRHQRHIFYVIYALAYSAS